MTDDENTTTPVIDREIGLLSIKEKECHVVDSCVE